MVNVEGHDKYLADLHGRSFGYHSTASRLEYLAVAPGSNTWRIMDWYHHRFMARRPILVPSWHLPRCIVAAAGPPRALVCSAWAVVSTGEHLLRFSNAFDMFWSVEDVEAAKWNSRVFKWFTRFYLDLSDSFCVSNRPTSGLTARQNSLATGRRMREKGPQMMGSAAGCVDDEDWWEKKN